MEQKILIEEPEFVCRICQEDTQPLILPCICKTTRVHRDCLQRWRYTDPTGERFYKCEICKYSYKLYNQLGYCSVVSYYSSVISLFILYMSIFCSVCFSISLGLGYIFSSNVIEDAKDTLHSNEIICRFLLGFSVLLCVVGAIGIITYYRENETGCFIYTCEDCSVIGFMLACVFFIFGVIIGIGYTVKISAYFFSKSIKITEQCVHSNIWQVTDLSGEFVSNSNTDVDDLQRQLL